jgi:hypothetical protein
MCLRIFHQVGAFLDGLAFAGFFGFVIFFEDYLHINLLRNNFV